MLIKEEFKPIRKPKINKTIEMEYVWKYSNPNNQYSWMINDLWRGIQAQENYLVALGLFTYSEALGRIILGDTGRCKGYRAFKEFTREYIGYSFGDDKKMEKIFDTCRNGLAHQYFIKKHGSGVYNEDGSYPCGIDFSENSYKIYIHSYFKHFVRGLEKAIDSGKLK